MSAPTPLTPLTNGEHEVRPVHTTHFFMPAQFSHPHHRHSIWCAKKCVVQDAEKCRLVLPLHHAVNTRDADVTFAPLGDGFCDGVERRSHVENADARAQHIDSLDVHLTSDFSREVSAHDPAKLIQFWRQHVRGTNFAPVGFQESRWRTVAFHVIIRPIIRSKS